MLRSFLMAVAAGLFACDEVTAAPAAAPNFIVIFTDNQGWQDLGVYGSTDLATPNIDQLAAEGMRFTDFYAELSCGPARAALMTGSYPPRLSLAFDHVPEAKTGIHPAEITLAELLRAKGYATMLVGKWHLGDHPQFLPLRHGFDAFYGIPYSNDMWPFHPLTHPTYPLDSEPPRLQAARRRAELTGFSGQQAGQFFAAGKDFPDLPLYQNDEIIEFNPEPDTLTTRFTQEAIEFIREHRDKPFFLYLAHAMPHTPLGASDRFRGKSSRGLYGDVIAEIDWSVGEIVTTLRELEIDSNTLIVYTSDNGPWVHYGIDSGTSWPFRGGAGTILEGGSRVPAIARWPGHIPPGKVTGEPVGLIDIYPTFARLAGAPLPKGRVIDGKDISALLLGEPGASSPHEARYYFLPAPPGEVTLGAVRAGRWKLHLRQQPTPRVLRPWLEVRLNAYRLYDLETDPTEVNDLLDAHPQMARQLSAMATRFRRDLQKSIRPLGKVDE